jgi:Flp pilus assembly protein TadG
MQNPIKNKGRARWLRRQSGQSLAEFAFVLPFLVALTIGAIEVGRYAYIAILVGNAARAGAAFGAQGLARAADSAGITTAANNDYLNNGPFTTTTALGVSSSTACYCDSGGLTTNLDCSVASCPFGGAHKLVVLSVTTSGTYTALFNYPVVPSSLTISNTAKMQVRQD